MPLEPTDEQLRALDMMLNRAISARKVWAAVRDHVLESAATVLDDANETVSTAEAAIVLRALKGRT
jgi:hypothetical protein